MKNIYQKLDHEAKQLYVLQEQMGVKVPPNDIKELEKRKTQMQKDGVGELQEIGEFGLGIAPRNAKPINKIELSKAKEEEIARMQVDDEESKDMGYDDEDDSKLEIVRLKRQREKKRRPIDRQSAFIEFKGLEEGNMIE